jgi:hypothetical protein
MANGQEKLISDGEQLRAAVRWIADQREGLSGADLARLVDQAALRFDLSPRDAQALHALVSDGALR